MDFEETVSTPDYRHSVLVPLAGRSVVFVGLMGAGKTAIGRKVATLLGQPFVDSDQEIESVSRMTIPELFERYGEPEFRALEQRVIHRILESGPQVLSTGGGAFMNAQTRGWIAERGVSVWLKADIDVLFARVSKKQNRPLLKNPDPRGTLERLITERYPVYALADVTVATRDERKEVIVDEVMDALAAHLASEPASRRKEPEMTAETIETVKVALGERGYEILIGAGLLGQAGAAIAERLPGARAAIVTDENVAARHLARLTESLENAGIGVTPVVLPPGEKTKSFSALQDVVDRVLAARLERRDVVIALGGGVIGDLAGFAAGIVRRGMNFVQVPTSLLAQVDSSVGGKTGINTAHGKNLVGVFQQPRLVLADTSALDSLPEREFRAGYAEVAKYGLIDRPEFFAFLEKNWREVFAGGPARAKAIAESCRAKAEVVARDEFETGDRALLNLGHTFGHALEAATAYDGARLVHGEGVAIGMALAYRFSARLNLASPDDAARVETHLKAVGLPWRISDIPGALPDAERLLGYIAQDKKVSRGALAFILTRGIGQAFIARDVPASEVLSFLREYLAA